LIKFNADEKCDLKSTIEDLACLSVTGSKKPIVKERIYKMANYSGRLSTQINENVQATRTAVEISSICFA